MRTAKQNIINLPDYCYTVLGTDMSLIRIEAGEHGYYPVSKESVSKAKKVFGIDDIDKLADAMNDDLGVRKSHRLAMEAGSAFGWEIEGANPDKYVHFDSAKTKLEI